ncbi:hypothetical protein HII12_005018 [Brettanomyces bruxellensis]|uniref:Nucleoporin NSP1 n=1 Tax=Dekkera bruxellensis TaxID=5007 RepID=A0A8H6EQG1_DEKBR|nr:hypothetical protein HII12_005018 [Brettanomyces bruxellensis]
MAFSFSVNNQNGNGSSGNTFGGDNSGTDNNSNNNLSFGSSNMNSTGLNLNKSSGNKGPSFNFGSQSQSGSLSANGNTNGTFNFGTNNNNKTLPGQNSSVGTKKLAIVVLFLALGLAATVQEQEMPNSVLVVQTVNQLEIQLTRKPIQLQIRKHLQVLLYQRKETKVNPLSCSESRGNANSAGTSDNSNAKTFNFAGVSSNLTKKAEDNPSSEDSDKNKKQSATSAPKFSFGVTKDDTSKSDSSSSVNKPTFTFGAKAINPVDKDTKTNKSAITEKGSQFTFDSSKNNDKLKQAPTNENNGKKHALPGFKTNDEKKAFVKVEDFKPKQVSITNKNLDDLINKWTNQLSSASKMFKNYGEKIRSWDEVMVSSSEKITKLYSDSLECENKQNKIDQTLSYIERQQEELETLLTGYEKQSESLLSSSRQGGSSEIVTVTSGGSIGSLTNDQVREKSYKLAEILEMRLNSLGTNFSSLISEVNKVNDNFNRSLLTSNSKTDEEEGLLEDVLKLLNSHLESLNWVEESERSLRMQVDKIKKSSI